MAAYLIVDIEVTDPAGMEEYRKGVGATLAQYGGKVRAVGGRIEVLEGDWQPKGMVVVEFDSMEQAKRWYQSPEYAPLIPVRQRSAQANLVLVEGVGP